MNQETTLERETRLFMFWQKLNHKPLAVYLRFQKLFALKNGGKWLRGLSISDREVSIIAE